jgi:tetratricopeptide (TPR) repeat protein
VFAVLWAYRSIPWCRATLFALACFAVTLFPALGFFDAAFFRLSRVADHFQYLASMAPLALAGSGIFRLLGKNPPNRISYPVLATILLLLGFLTFRQCAIYRDLETLWNDTVAKNPGCAIAHNNLGFCLRQRGETARALQEVQTALSLDPNFPDALNNLGSDCLDHGDLDRAISLLRRSVREEPINTHGHFNLGNALFLKGQTAEAVTEYRLAIASSPYSPVLHVNLAGALVKQENLQEGIAELQKALDLNPSDTASLNNLAWILATASPHSIRDGNRALELAAIAVQRTSGDPRTLRTLAAAYATSGHFEEAAGTAREGIGKAKAARNVDLARVLEEDLALYEKHSTR